MRAHRATQPFPFEQQAEPPVHAAQGTLMTSTRSVPRVTLPAKNAMDRPNMTAPNATTQSSGPCSQVNASAKLTTTN